MLNPEYRNMECAMKKIILPISLFMISSFHHLYAMDISGKWKTIDDKTGFSRADVVISKTSEGKYVGKVVTIRPLPDKPLVETCQKCKGDLKDKPYVGMQIISDFVSNPDNPAEFINGRVLDPLSGNIYRGKIKLNPTGKRLTLRGYVGVEVIGRSQTWIRAE